MSLLVRHVDQVVKIADGIVDDVCKMSIHGCDLRIYLSDLITVLLYIEKTDPPDWNLQQAFDIIFRKRYVVDLRKERIEAVYDGLVHIRLARLVLDLLVYSLFYEDAFYRTGPEPVLKMSLLDIKLLGKDIDKVMGMVLDLLGNRNDVWKSVLYYKRIAAYLHLAVCRCVKHIHHILRIGVPLPPDLDTGFLCSKVINPVYL